MGQDLASDDNESTNSDTMSSLELTTQMVKKLCIENGDTEEEIVRLIAHLESTNEFDNMTAEDFFEIANKYERHIKAIEDTLRKYPPLVRSYRRDEHEIFGKRIL